MTNHERAEKIFLMRSMFSDNRLGQDLIVSKIAAILDEAVREALSDFSKDANIVLETSVDAARVESFDLAKEKAARLIEDFDDPECNGGLRYAKEIRAMEPDK